MAAARWRVAMAIATAGCIAAAAPAVAQFSGSYKFMDAVKDRDAAKAKAALDQPGSTVANTRALGTGDTALHLVTRGRDLAWMAFLLQNGASTAIRDNAGDTALMTATRLGFGEGARLLISVGAPVNLANNRGETPLIVAVQNRDAALVRTLLEAGANPRQSDSVAGQSARDYAAQDPRASAILRMIDSVKSSPAKKISGPR